MEIQCDSSDLVVFALHRWNLIFERPQHLMSRFAVFRRVYYFEEPVYRWSEIPHYYIQETHDGVQIVTPYLPEGINYEEKNIILMRLLNELIEDENMLKYTLWYYDINALDYSRHLVPHSTVYDCTEESLSHPTDETHVLSAQEEEMFRKADLVFTSGQCLYEAKKYFHHNIHSIPNSIDYEHFSLARFACAEPNDQAAIKGPRLGFSGLIDHYLDLDLLAAIARLRPDWSFIILGAQDHLNQPPPVLPNIHYLGKKDYHELPSYIAGWACAILPFLLNDRTRFINPLATAEFLAAGLPVVATGLQEIANPYVCQNLVFLAKTAEEFCLQIEEAMKQARKADWLKKVDSLLSYMSWDLAWKKMAEHEWLLGGYRAVHQMKDNLTMEQTLPGGFR